MKMSPTYIRKPTVWRMIVSATKLAPIFILVASRPPLVLSRSICTYRVFFITLTVSPTPAHTTTTTIKSCVSLIVKNHKPTESAGVAANFVFQNPNPRTNHHKRMIQLIRYSKTKHTQGQCLLLLRLPLPLR